MVLHDRVQVLYLTGRELAGPEVRVFPATTGKQCSVRDLQKCSF